MSAKISGKLFAHPARGYSSTVYDGFVINNEAGGRRFVVDDAKASVSPTGIFDPESREAMGIPSGMLHLPTGPLLMTQAAFQRAQQSDQIAIELDNTKGRE